LKIIIETDEKKEVYGNIIDMGKSDRQNAGPAPESLSVESVSSGTAEIYPTDSGVIDGGTPPQHLLEALQTTIPLGSNLRVSMIENAGSAPSSDIE
jgi:hypothetical protein